VDKELYPPPKSNYQRKQNKKKDLIANIKARICSNFEQKTKYIGIRLDLLLIVKFTFINVLFFKKKTSTSRLDENGIW